MSQTLPSLKRFILTRPVEQSCEILKFLPAKQTWLWPAFSFSKSEGSSFEIKKKLSNLEDVDSLFFVSPTAVFFTRDLLPKVPQSLKVYCVGEGTARAIYRTWGEEINVIYPTGASKKSGSEALFEEIKRDGFPKHLLIFRAQHGREWLSEQLEKEGVCVEKLCVYERVPLFLGQKELQDIEKSIKNETPVLLMTSTEAVNVIKNAVASVSGAFEWLKSGIAITIHERVFSCLREAGFSRVRLCETTNPFDLAKTMLLTEDEKVEVNNEA